MRFLGIFVLAGALYAQTDTGTLAGDVSDPTGAAVARASVRVDNRASKASRQTLSDAQGHYQFPLLAPGTYDVTVEARGFKTVVDAGVKVQVAQEATLSIQLELGSTSESIQVESSASMVNTESVA